MSKELDYIPIYIDGIEYKGYFMADYIRRNNFNRYELSKIEKQNRVQLLTILGRKRLNKIVVETSEDFKSKNLSDKKGVFTILFEGKKKQVVLKNQYCKHFSELYEQKVQHDIYNDKIEYFAIKRKDSKPVYLIALN